MQKLDLELYNKEFIWSKRMCIKMEFIWSVLMELLKNQRNKSQLLEQKVLEVKSIKMEFIWSEKTFLQQHKLDLELSNKEFIWSKRTFIKMEFIL